MNQPVAYDFHGAYKEPACDVDEFSRKRKQSPSVSTNRNPYNLSSETRKAQAAEKRAIYDRLIVYRRKNGIGCFGKLAEMAGVTIVAIYSLMDGDVMPIETWRAVGCALDRAGKGA